MPELAKPAWIDFKLSLPTFITILVAAAGLISQFSKLEMRVDSLQNMILDQNGRISQIRDEAERRDVAASERASLVERLKRIEGKIDAIR